MVPIFDHVPLNQHRDFRRTPPTFSRPPTSQSSSTCPSTFSYLLSVSCRAPRPDTSPFLFTVTNPTTHARFNCSRDAHRPPLFILCPTLYLVHHPYPPLMEPNGLKQRHHPSEPKPIPPEDLQRHGIADTAPSLQHPAGPVKHGGPMQALRMSLFGLYFLGSCLW